MTDPLVAAAEQTGAMLPGFYVLYVFSKTGALLALWHHPNRIAVEAKRRDCQKGAMFASCEPTYRIMHYVAKEEVK